MARTVEISERPKALTHEWFNILSEKAGMAYQALVRRTRRVSAHGGRGRGAQGRGYAEAA